MFRTSSSALPRRIAVDLGLTLVAVGYGLLIQPQVMSTTLGGVGSVGWVTAALAISGIWWLRRSSPEWFAVLAVGSTLLCDLTGALPPLALATIAVRRPVPRTLVAGVSMAAVVLLQVWLRDVPEPVSVAAGTVVFFAAAAGWGVAVRNRREVVVLLRRQVDAATRAAAQQALDARRDERTRIARDMHDTLAHRMSLLAIQGAAIEERADSADPDVRELAGSMRGAARDSLEDLRWMMDALHDDDEAVALHPPVDPSDVRRLVEEAGTLGDVVLDVQPGWSALDGVPAPIGHVLYRVVQEALTNARKHGSGRPVAVTIMASREHHIEVDVAERGEPATRTAPRAALPGAGRGLLGLEERTRAVGGHVEHGPGPDGGFRVRARLPWYPGGVR
ncbi:MAG: histidine kinase [Actinomycetia bacterium]|nr:histidine kinase [Actinomycetes bacterium]